MLQRTKFVASVTEVRKGPAYQVGKGPVKKLPSGHYQGAIPVCGQHMSSDSENTCGLILRPEKDGAGHAGPIWPVMPNMPQAIAATAGVIGIRPKDRGPSISLFRTSKSGSLTRTHQ